MSLPLSDEGQHKEHPDVHADDERVLEQDLAEHELAQVERAVDDDERELQDQHDQERDRHLVLLQVRLHAAVALVRLVQHKICLSGIILKLHSKSKNIFMFLYNIQKW